MTVYEFSSTGAAQAYADAMAAEGYSYRIKLKTFPKRLKKPMVTEVTVYE